MSGSIRQRGRNSWEIRVYSGTDPETGQRRQLSRTVRGSRTQAQRELRSLATFANVGPSVGARTTLGELLDRWFAANEAGWATGFFSGTFPIWTARVPHPQGWSQDGRAATLTLPFARRGHAIIFLGPSMKDLTIRGTADNLGGPQHVDMGMIRRALVLSLGAGLVASSACTDTRSQPPRTSDTAVSPHSTNSSASPIPMSPGLDPKDVVLVFGRDGDIWLAMASGDVVNATKSTRKERNPTISYDGDTVVFERGRDLVYLRLSDGSTKAFAEGSWPTFGPRGYLAWANEEGEIVVGSPFSTATTSHPATKEGGAWVEHLAWDQNLELLYYEAVIGEGAVPYAMDVVRLDGWQCSSCGGGIDLVAPRPIYPDNSREGSEYLTTALGSDVGVIRVCCRRSEAGGWQEAEVGGIEYFDWGTRYHRLRRLDDLALNLSGNPLLLRDAGRLRAEVRNGEVVRWTTTNDTAWLVGDGAQLWLVRWHGDATKLPFKVDGGAAASPRYSKSLFVRRNWNL